MINKSKAFSSFSVDSIPEAKKFYGDTLGLDVTEQPEGLKLEIGGLQVFLYPKEGHEPATFTVLNFPVKNVEETVDELTDAGITFEQYTGGIETDEKGIFRGDDETGGPTEIAWFADPAGNILSIMTAEYMEEDNKKTATAKAK
jgi:catechol 2,3-dioxygenase-like lactoylglutathione lyase family enzyme